VRKDGRERKDQRESPERLVFKGGQVRKELLVHKDQQVSLEPLEYRELQELKE
jgi:hypothetical protein